MSPRTCESGRGAAGQTHGGAKRAHLVQGSEEVAERKAEMRHRMPPGEPQNQPSSHAPWVPPRSPDRVSSGLACAAETPVAGTVTGRAVSAAASLGLGSPSAASSEPPGQGCPAGRSRPPPGAFHVMTSSTFSALPPIERASSRGGRIIASILLALN